MRYDVRIDGHTIETFKTFEAAQAQDDLSRALDDAQRLKDKSQKAVEDNQ